LVRVVTAPSLAAFALAVALLAAACAEAGPTAVPDTGIKGVVTLGPTCPVEQPGQSPCVAPYAATLAITNADDGKVVARVTSGQDGTFQVTVAPGDYVIAPQPGGDPFPVGQPVAVHVDAGAFTEVGVSYDTGIR
jgi:hypothetical protein